MRPLLVLATLFLFAGCGGESAGSQVSLHGTVTRGPVSPTCVRGQACSKPAAGVTLRFLQDGKVAGKALTDGDGSYRIALAAGRYLVAGPGPLRPRRVTVAGSRRVDFSIDTRIR